jgi:energy-coupling factor transporter ATP-binding protein EcfA2
MNENSQLKFLTQSIQTMTHQLRFTETVNVSKCIKVMHLSKADLKDTFWERDSFDHNFKKLDWTNYFLMFRKYLREAIESKTGRIVRDYKYAAGQTDGRIYVKGSGVQTMQRNLRNYICGEYYYDVDMVNCHLRILNSVCIEEHIMAPLLQEYCDERAQILADNNLTKRDILIATYTDHNRKKNNDWYNAFIFELARVKKEILPLIPDDVKTTNTTNPDSSRISQFLCQIENKILQQVIQYFGKCAEVPMFDGVMVHRSFCSESEIESHVNTLNAMFEEEYHGCIEFAMKPTECDIEIPDLDNEPKDYMTAKALFEVDFFHTKHPFVFWQQSRRSDGSYAFNQLRAEEFKIACKTHQIIDFKDNGDMFVTSIYDRWIKDQTKRQYESIDFIPYGKENVCPSFIYNTFEGFEVNKILNHEKVDTSNFDHLIYHLCNEDKPLAEYLTKFIAHMFQYPNRLPEKVIVLKGWTGCGKDTLFRTLRRLMGHKYISITENPDHVFGNFNEIMQNKLCVFLNEMEGKHGINYQEKIKGQSTATENRVNGKYEKAVTQRNFARMFFNSNQNAPVNVQVNDRRYVIVQCGFGLVKNTNDKRVAGEVEKFWEEYYNNMNDANWCKSLYEYLMNIDLEEWNWAHDPKTVAKEVLRSKNINPLHYFLHEIDQADDKQQYGFLTAASGKHIIKWKTFCTNYKQYVERVHPQVDYVIKDTTVKSNLTAMPKDTFEGDKVIRYSTPDGDTKTGRFCIFDFDLINKFFHNFIFNDVETVEDIGVVDDRLPKYSLGFITNN